MTHNWRPGLAVVSGLVLLLVLTSAVISLASAESTPSVSPAAGTGVAGSGASGGIPANSATACPLTSSEQTHLLTLANDPSWAGAVQHIRDEAAGALSNGLPAGALHLPYTGSVPDQVVNGVPMTGVQIAAECSADGMAGPTPAPAGVAYDGQSYRGDQLANDPTIDTNSLVGILTVNSIQNFYPDSATPTFWGAQLNAVLANVTILGHRGYDFWVQNVVSYDSHTDKISFVDDTWNFTSYVSEMQPSSLVSWSPNGSDYTGTWVAFSQVYYAPPPFTAYVYVNSSVNGAGDQVLWYNYSLVANHHFYHGTYDNLVFRSQASGARIALGPAPFEASATTVHLVNEGYEFDAFIGADDGSNQLVLGASATEQLEYCTIRDCRPTDFRYGSVPAAVNYGSQTGEETVGVAVNYIGTTAYLSAGPLVLHGLWNFTGEPGVSPGNTEVLNNLVVSGSPVPIIEQPYVFVFFQNVRFASQTYQWAADVPAWYLMPGTYRYAVMLADYREQTGALTVGGFTAVLSARLPYSYASGVYTPLWAFDDAQVAGISSRGAGTISEQYVLFNNPTSNCQACGAAPDGSLSPLFFSQNDYTFKTFAGVFLSGTHAYVDVDRPPPFRVHATASASTSYYLNFQFYETSHVTLSHAAAIEGWPAQSEISFYLTVPASQNPAPQGDVYVWDSTHDLIMANTFVAVKPQAGDVSPDQLVLYGGRDNVVWGNIFRDPFGVPFGRGYAGIGIAESGDLIYNNNFSIDNPVVVLPYNFPHVADCLPQCSESNRGDTWFYDYAHETWNVTPQPASNVAETVNGFRLSGNVMGPGYTVVGGNGASYQGGNFFWNFGRAPNNRTSLPYVARFLYTDWSNLFPLGCGTIQPPGAPCGTPPSIVGAFRDGIQIGGDYAPIVRSGSGSLAALTSTSGSLPGAADRPALSTSSVQAGFPSCAPAVRSSGPRAAREGNGQRPGPG